MVKQIIFNGSLKKCLNNSSVFPTNQILEKYWFLSIQKCQIKTQEPKSRSETQDLYFLLILELAQKLVKYLCLIKGPHHLNLSYYYVITYSFYLTEWNIHEHRYSSTESQTVNGTLSLVLCLLLRQRRNISVKFQKYCKLVALWHGICIYLVYGSQR